MTHQDFDTERSLPSAPIRWKNALLCIGLVVLIVGLNYLATRDERRQPPEAPAKSSSATDRERSPRNKPRELTEANAEESRQRNKSSEASAKKSGGNGGQPPEAKTEAPPRNETQRSTNNGDDSLVIRNIRIRDENGRVVYSGDVDLRPTLDRIERGKRLRFPNDGVVFENRERRLPGKSNGYYHEYVLPTPGDDGPGPQRVVAGRNGEVYYTPDHYKSFRRIK